MTSRLTVRVLRTDADMETVRDAWCRWHRHPHVELDFFLMINRIRSEVISPYVIALYRDGLLDALLVGRLERVHLTLNLGYWNLMRFPGRSLTFIYDGLLGNATPENCTALMHAVSESLKQERALLSSFHFMRADSPLHQAAVRSGSILCRDFFPESRPHWIMRVPRHVDEILDKMSPKTRQTRRSKSRRLFKDFPNGVHVRRYDAVGDIDCVMKHAESIACRTYQRGLGVGFVDNQETRQRFALEVQRNGFRGYFLYAGEKPIAFFLGTLYKGVLYDNFTAYDPDYARYSPGEFLFLAIFEELCQDGTEIVDFGFGDAWYKAHFGTDTIEEVTVATSSMGVKAVTFNILRTSVRMLDHFGRKAAQNLTLLGALKKRFRKLAQERASAGIQ